ncbi:RNA polymerase II mediator complex subunit [Candida orthopsilosis Co 90-125]|uniref:Mediator of RNA polymerase II transcription subunit 10 n=1 Tax=Candida orthopsilosis (strain 90-125) TaxID=1136231 RepID=H8WXV9_CANO9|nr:RNA polymerase II mediator complex subunit [Candida orthopsilosis Co 90-125]CCG20906.1 RNA polymerase II mediator complex subunit [Candida orthopsilosis Co 90-125]
MTTTSIAPTEDNASLVQAAEKVANLIESFIELGILVHDNQGTPQSNLALSNKIQTLASQLKAVSHSDGLKDKLVPIDVVSYIEDGRNPDIYTREFIEVTAKSNAKLKGKMQGFNKLGNILSEKLVQEYPRLEAGLKDIKSRTTFDSLSTYD